MKLTSANLKDIIEGISFSEFRSISFDNDSKKAGDKKTVSLKVNYDGLTLGDVIAKAFNSDCVSWANGSSGRKNYNNLKDRQVIEISAKTPGKAPQVDPEQAMIAKLQAMTPEEQKTYLATMLTKATK